MQTFHILKKAKKPEIKTPIYLDISFSVLPFLDRIRLLLSAIMQSYKFKLYCFSTDVKKLTIDEVENGKFSSGGGTNINEVFKHYFSLKREERGEKIFIITDEIFYEKLKYEYRSKIRKNDMEAHIWNISNGNHSIYFGALPEEKG